jgi:hypothetical protein
MHTRLVPFPVKYTPAVGYGWGMNCGNAGFPHIHGHYDYDSSLLNEKHKKVVFRPGAR